MFNIKTPTHHNTPLTANHTFQGHVDDNGLRSCDGREEWERDDWRQMYQGAFFQDSLHSRGEYLWDHHNLRWNYEGHFYSDNKEGYGRVSYPEGGLFEGLFVGNRRFGPGVFTQPDGRQDVGLWRGPRLVRLSAVVDGVPRLGTSLEAKVKLLRYRTLVPIKEDIRNVAREVLENLTDKEPVLETSGRLYSPLVRDERSLFFDKALHDSLYFGRDCGDEDITVEDKESETNVLSAEGEKVTRVTRPTKTVAATHLLAWNNGEQMKRLLRHVFRHRHFEVTLSYNMEWVVAGHRGKFSLPGDHEDACLNLLSCCLDGRIQTMAEVLNTADINPDVTDARGNSGLMYAVSVDCHEAIDMLLNHGADVNLVNDEGFTPLALCMTRILAVLKDVKDWGKAFLQRKDYKEAETGAEWRLRASYSQLNPNKLQSSAGCHIGISRTEERTGSSGTVAVPAVDQEYVLSLIPRPVPPPEKGRKVQKLQKGVKKSVKIVLSSHSEENSTLEKSRAPNLDRIRETIAHLLRRGASPGASEVVCPTLEMAVHARDVVLVELLLAHGADSNALNETGLTPLHVVGLITPSRELVDICELLLRYHADPNLGAQEEVDRDSQVGILGERRMTDVVVGRKTPLHAICMRTDASLEGKEFLESLCRLLLEKGEADASITYLGHCPLSLALLRGHKDLARALLASGRVDPNQALGRDLGVPLALLLSPHCAELHDSAALVEMCDILFEFGADPLKIFSARDEFRGNVLDWGYREVGALLREEKSKKGGQPKKKGRDNTKQLMAVIDRLKDLGRSCLVRHIQGNLVQTLLTAIRQGREKGTKEVKKWLTVSDAARCLWLLMEGEVTKVSREEAHQVMTAVARGRGDQVKGHLYLLFGPEESEVDLFQGAEKDVSESSVESLKKERPLDRGFMQKKFDLQLSRSSTEIQQVINSPFVVPPELDNNIEKFRVCFECLSKSEKVLLKCPKCKMIYFCSEECNLANDERSSKHSCQMLFYNEERDKYDEEDSDETWSTVDSEYDSDRVFKGDTDEDSDKEERKRKGKNKRIETDDEDSSREDKKRRRRKKGKRGETDNEDSDNKRVRRKGKKGETDDEGSEKEKKKRGRKGKKEETDDEGSEKEDKKRRRRKGKNRETDEEDSEKEDKSRRRKGKKEETDDEGSEKEDKKRGRRKGKKEETDEDSDKEDKKRRRKKGKRGENDDEGSEKEGKTRGRKKGKKEETNDEGSEKDDKKRRRKGKNRETHEDSDKKRGRKKGKKIETDDEDSENDMKSKRDKKKRDRTEEDKRRKGHKDDNEDDRKRAQKQKDNIGERRRKTKMRDESEDGSIKRKGKQIESKDDKRKEKERKDESKEKSKRDKRGESKGDRRRKPEKHGEKHRHKHDTKEEKYKDKDRESDHATTSDRRDKSKGRQKKDKAKSERSKKQDKEDGSKTERGRNRVKEKGETSKGQKLGPVKKDRKIQKSGLEKKRPEREAGKSRERRPGEYKGAERKKKRSPSGTRKVEEGPDYGAAKLKDPKLAFPEKYEEFMLQVAGSSGWGHDLEGLILPYTVFRNGNFYYRLHGPTPKFVENYSLL